MMPSQESARVFLTGLFSTLQQMVDNAMKNTTSERHENLLEAKTKLESVSSNLTESPILLDEVEGKLEEYKKKVQDLLDNKIEPGDRDAVRKTAGR